MTWIVLWIGLAASAPKAERATELATRMVEELGPRPAGTEAGDAAQVWVHRAIAERGWRPQQSMHGHFGTVWTCRRGESPRVVLFLAHTDSVHLDVPGAHDNAAAVAVLLTAMEARIPETPPRTVCFAFPDGEEVGLVGAEGFAVRAVDQQMLGGPIDQVMSLELVGAGRLVHNGLGPAWDGPRIRELLRVAPAEVPWMYRGVSWAAPEMERSDHRPFADRGIPSSMLLGRTEANVLWVYHTEQDRPETLQPDTLGAAVRLVRGVARARPLPASTGPDPAVVLFGWVVPGLWLRGVLGAAAAAGLWSIRGLDRTVGAALLHVLWVALAFATGVSVAGLGRPLHAALVEEVWAAGWLAALGALFVWPWRASSLGAGALLGIWSLLVLAATPWIGVPLAAPVAVAVLAGIAACRSPGWCRLPALPLACWPLLHLVRPAALRELAFHHLLPATPWAWGVLFALLAVPPVLGLQGRGLPRRRGPWIVGLGIAWALATAWAWSQPVHDADFPPRIQKWAGRP